MATEPPVTPNNRLRYVLSEHDFKDATNTSFTSVQKVETFCGESLLKTEERIVTIPDMKLAKTML